MYLVMFDVDGTLTRSYQYDQQCYAETLHQLTGLTVDTNWQNYPHVSDSSVTQTVIKRHQLAAEIAELAERDFSLRLLAMHQQAPEQFQAITGANQLLQELQQAGIAISIATGCWRNSALIKLDKSGIQRGELPMATASDAYTRQDIMRESARRAAVHYGVGQFEQIVYVGDGEWDVRCSAELGYQFIGIGESIAQLRRLGAECTLPDYSNSEQFWNFLASFGLQTHSSAQET